MALKNKNQKLMKGKLEIKERKKEVFHVLRI